MATRRHFLKITAAAGLAPAVVSAQGKARVVVIGGGFGGATAARTVKVLQPALDVTLVEPNPVYTSCPFSNSVLANLREIDQQQFGYDGIRGAGVTVAQTSATAVDAEAKSVTTLRWYESSSFILSQKMIWPRFFCRIRTSSMWFGVRKNQ